VSFQTEQEERAEKLIRELHEHKLGKEVRIVLNYVVLIDTREIQSKEPMGWALEGGQIRHLNYGQVNPVTQNANGNANYVALLGALGEPRTVLYVTPFTTGASPSEIAIPSTRCVA
jgi:hypothetical protein